MTTREKAERLYRKVNAFILTCTGSDGYPLTKAVSPGKYRGSMGEIYFCTNTSSNFVAEISKNAKACVYFYSQRLMWKGCQLKGDMEIVTDLGIKEKYWQNKFKNAYPQTSFVDPDFCVLKFIPKSGRYYSLFKPENFEI